MLGDMWKWLLEIPKRHPYKWAVGCFLFGSLPQWISSIWSFFSDKPLADVIRPHLKAMNIPDISPYWITATVGVAMFLWLAYELRQSRNDNNQQENTTLEEMIHRLAELRTSGVGIRNSGQSMTEPFFRDWVHSVETWRHEVFKAIEYISKTDARLFDTLDIVPAPRVHAVMHSENEQNIQAHSMFFRQHDYRLVKLEVLIDKYQRMADDGYRQIRVT